MNRTFISNLEPRKDNYEILTFTSEKIIICVPVYQIFQTTQ